MDGFHFFFTPFMGPGAEDCYVVQHTNLNPDKQDGRFFAIYIARFLSEHSMQLL